MRTDFIKAEGLCEEGVRSSFYCAVFHLGSAAHHKDASVYQMGIALYETAQVEPVNGPPHYHIQHQYIELLPVQKAERFRRALDYRNRMSDRAQIVFKQHHYRRLIVYYKHLCHTLYPLTRTHPAPLITKEFPDKRRSAHRGSVRLMMCATTLPPGKGFARRHKSLSLNGDRKCWIGSLKWMRTYAAKPEPLLEGIKPQSSADKKITEESLGRVSLPFFLRPFNGCVPQPEKKRRLFDSHNPNSLMVAELAAIYHSTTRLGTGPSKKQKSSIYPAGP